jgi:hypothetical protein
MVAEDRDSWRAARIPVRAVLMPVDPISTASAAFLQITGAIRQAAQAVGTSFSYLLATARVESNFDPNAKASTSSARGLFQFIEQTWLSTMKEAGPRLGYGSYADAIVRTPSGRLQVPDPAMRAQILNLRHDPTANAVMAGALTKSNAAVLRGRLGRPPSEGELYIAHFMGVSGAARLIAAAAKPDVSAAELFPNAARANRSIFYDKQGRARDAAEVYTTLTGRYDVARTGRAAPTEVASAAIAARKIPRAVPDTAGVTQAFAASDPQSPRQGTAPVFHVLFHTGEALASKVQHLWGAQSEARTAQDVTKPSDVITAARPSGGPREFFQDVPSDERGWLGAKS